MKINHGVEKEDGSYVFQGELNGEQLKYLVGIGINVTLAQGALPFVSEEDHLLASIVPQGTDYEQ